MRRSTLIDTAARVARNDARLFKTGAGLHAADWAGGNVRAMELPDGRLIVGAVYNDAEAAASAVEELCK